MVKKKCNAAQWKYINDLAEKFTSDDAKLFLRYISSRRKGTNDLVSSKEEEKEIMDDTEIAESMNE